MKLLGKRVALPIWAFLLAIILCILALFAVVFVQNHFRLSSGLISTLITSLSTVLVALFGIIQLSHQLENQNKTRVAAYRVDWNNGLRESVKEFLSLCSTYFDIKLRRERDRTDKSNASNNDDGVKLDDYKTIREKEAGIRLQVYAGEVDHGIICEQVANHGKGCEGACCVAESICKRFEIEKDAKEEVQTVARTQLVYCVHRLSRIIGIKDGTELGFKAFSEQEDGDQGLMSLDQIENQFNMCYDGIVAMTSRILKTEWERAKTLDGEYLD